MTLTTLISVVAAEAVESVVPAISPLVVIEGRHVAHEDGSALMGYPGVTLHVKFRGSALKINLEAMKEDLFLDVCVDGGEYEWVALQLGEQCITLVEVDPGEHEVEIIRRNENWQGLLRVQSLEVIGGEFLSAPELPEKKLMFIGDSITCGDSCDIREEGPHSRGFVHNGRLSYGYQISQILNAQCHLVSYGGRGMIRDWQGNRATNNAPQFYERSIADDAKPFCQHEDYVPDAIGICLGTNDFSRGIADQNEFVNASVEFVRKLMRDAPEATIFLIDSPMFGTEGNDGVKRNALSMYLDQVVEFVGCDRVKHLNLGHYPGRPENAHPIAHEHAEIAKVLAPYFEAVLEQ